DFVTFNAHAAMTSTDAVPPVGRSVTIAFMARIFFITMSTCL
nr:hypothetical protein [Tanacetum cinerariifolium]